jgi:hypothetical protein
VIGIGERDQRIRVADILPQAHDRHVEVEQDAALRVVPNE